MRHVLTPHSLEDSIKKSRFIAILQPSLDERAALRFIHQLHEQHPHASHVVFAYRILTTDGLIARFNDAGEPSGTAGKPIFQHLEGKNLINVTLAVIRYFGGIKLGAGGLTRAYSNTASAVIDSANVVAFVQKERIQLTLDYQQLQACQYHLLQHAAQILEQTFAEQVTLVIEIATAESAALLSKLKLHSWQPIRTEDF